MKAKELITTPIIDKNPVILQVTDLAGVAIDQSFSINVDNTNDAPTFTSTAITAVNEDATYTYNITSTDPDAGETVKAFVVPGQGQLLDEKEVIDFCKTYLASYKKPTAVAFIREIPRNPSGKALKRLLKEAE